MRFKVNTDEFLKLSNTIARGIGAKGDITNTVFEIIRENDVTKLLMTLRGQTSFFKGKVRIFDLEMEESETDKWGIDGNQFKQVLPTLAYMPPESLIFEMDSNNRIFNLRSKDNLYKILVYEAPILQSEEEIRKICTVDALQFTEMTSSLTKLCSNVSNHSESPISCLHLKVTNDEIIGMGTNSISISELRIPNSDFVNETQKMIKPAQVSILQGSFSNGDLIELIDTPTMFGYIDMNGTISLVSISTLPFLAYQQFKNLASSEQTAIVAKDELKFIVDSLSRICADNNEVQFVFENNSIFLHSSSGDKMRLLTESTFADTKMRIMMAPLSSLFGIMTEKIQFCWAKPTESNARGQLVEIKALDKDLNVIDSVFMGISTNDVR